MFRLRLLTMSCCVFVIFLGRASHADTKTAATDELRRPESLTVAVGDVVIRIDGPKMWTLSRIDYRKTIMAIEDSAYGSIFTIRDVGALGSAHFLDVPGKPGEVEKEDVTRLEFLLDDQPVTEITPQMNLAGESFRMDRRSQIRSIELDSRLSLEGGVLIEAVRVRSKTAVDLRIAAAAMYAWTPTATMYLFGDDEKLLSRGTFLPDDAKPTEGGDKAARWMAVYDPPSETGAVSYILQQPPGAGTWIQFTDAPGVYRKLRVLYFPEQIMPAGFDGTFQTATVFFKANEAEWEAQAQKAAGELQALAAKLKLD